MDKPKDKKEETDFAEEFQKLKVEKITLSEEDFEKLVEAIENPPKPNEKLLDAAKRHKDKFGK